MRTDAEDHELRSLVFKRLDEGLKLPAIATRTGVPYNTLKKLVLAGRPTDMARNEKVVETLAALRVKVRGLRSGSQTHEVQDAQVAMIRDLDTIETELRLSKDKD